MVQHVVVKALGVSIILATTALAIGESVSYPFSYVYTEPRLSTSEGPALYLFEQMSLPSRFPVKLISVDSSVSSSYSIMRLEKREAKRYCVSVEGGIMMYLIFRKQTPFFASQRGLSPSCTIGIDFSLFPPDPHAEEHQYSLVRRLVIWCDRAITKKAIWKKKTLEFEKIVSLRADTIIAPGEPASAFHK